jgi:hypothetical protein
MTRIDRISWIVRPENIKRYVEELETLLDVQFDHQYGPEVSGRDLDAYLCWDGGLEIVAPLGSATELTAMISKRLEERGEGVSSLVVGVSDLDIAAERARTLGYSVSEQIQHPDPAERLRRLRKYTTKVDDVREVRVGHFLGIGLVLGQITYAKRD